jgi:hypothetical protein
VERGGRAEQEGEEQQQSGAGAAHPGPGALQHCPGSGSGSSRERGGTGVRPGDRVRRSSHAPPRRRRGVERAVAAGREGASWIWEEGACGG